jgi:hypothetical protein
MSLKRCLYILPETGETVVLTVLTRSATGMAFDKSGNLYLASGGSANQEGVIHRAFLPIRWRVGLSMPTTS